MSNRKKPLKIKFTPKQIALFETIRVPGMNNSGEYKKNGVLALQYLAQEAKRKEEKILSRMEMRPTLKRLATISEKLKGKKDEYKQTPLIVGMSGSDPIGEFVISGIGLNGVGALAKTGLWNIAKYTPKTWLGNYGRLYFIGNSFKNSFNGNVSKPIINPLIITNTNYLRPVLEPGLTSLKFFERKPSKLSEAERRGIPKGERAENNLEVIQNAKLFAEKYGYDIPKNIDLIKDMYRLHNRFFRTVTTEPFDNNPNLYPELKGLNHEQKIKLLASKGYPKFYRSWDPKDIGFGFNDDFVFVSPSIALNIKYSNGDLSNTIMLQRPFSFRKPNKWHINADWEINPSTLNIHTKGMISEGNAPIYDEAKISTEYLIPIKIAEKTDKGSLKKK